MTELDEPPTAPIALGRRLRDAVTLRAVLLVVGVLLLQLSFIVSYVGALHHPQPHHIPLAVVAPPQNAVDLVGRLNGLPDEPLDARSVLDESAARRQIDRREVDAALVIEPDKDSDRLLVTGAGGPALADAVGGIVGRVYTEQGRRLTVSDVKPVASGDGRGLSAFYLVVGWIVGGYLVAAILGLSSGTRPANPSRAVIRLLALALYAIVSGLGGALIVGPMLDALPDSLVGLWALGALIVFATAAATMALQVLAGLVGIGVAILFFVVLGNPSSGGPFPQALLPTFWRVIGPYLPTGAGTSATRNVAYFDGAALALPLWVLAIYAVLGVAITLIVSARFRDQPAPPPF
ncbi:Protein of unknown function (DUF3533) [Streptoalloteichus tenebrarius]|uniref:DUF3533 domain-containing protein n=1 Tax=Streptoalloteichus tenebrarius (strain ATCC 17920 / DSM 40477 / JCM 4838 / CBS 697.72 / NBRC 16177 / NCIMB 11028 / NRRL B-12390 / A12253. 1 / ISP 5477) TaxID=1933 RepID=A0ABT1HX83_STRSD|nr:DUF3533 domain-containing protein [Streptoalloteichus tenebrarius]MCP2260126.1 Protein of unknown function (DUF3533) [Streptoalloteichus tenebrarius]